jgi:hypothetical protein
LSGIFFSGPGSTAKTRGRKGRAKETFLNRFGSALADSGAALLRLGVNRVAFLRDSFALPLRLCAFAVIGTLLAGGCTNPRTAAPPVNLAGFPPAFREGHADGCRSARGRQVRDEKRYAADRQYAAGWRDGLDTCRRHM